MKSLIHWRRNSHLNVCLSLVAVLACTLFSGGVARADNTTYNLSGAPGGNATAGQPMSGYNLQIGDTIILSATASKVANFQPITALWALSATTLVSVQAINGYAGWNALNPTIFYNFQPYSNLGKLLDPSLLPGFSVNSDTAYMGGTIKQDPASTPQDILAAAPGVPNNVWPFTIASEDAYDSTGNFRVDMQNAKWTMLSMPDDPKQRNQLLLVQGDYSVTPTIRGNAYSINLEHVILANGVAGQGGAIYFQGPNGNLTNGTLWSTAIVNGDVAFFGNISTSISNSGGGGAVFAWSQSLQFTGNAIFVGNMAGAPYDSVYGSNAFQFQGGLAQQCTGGAIRLYTSGSQLTFSGRAEFDGNMSGGSGGALATWYGGVILFNNKTIFMGNRAGMFVDITNSRNYGGGGAISSTTGSGSVSTSVFDLRFMSEAYFIGNSTSGGGGAIFGDSTHNAIAAFHAPTVFTDNTAGYLPQLVTMYMKVGGGSIPTLSGSPWGSIDSTGMWSGTTTMGIYAMTKPGVGTIDIQKVGWGGAVAMQVASLSFYAGAPVTFERNLATGIGGALGLLSSGNGSGAAGTARIAAAFYDSASFLGNIAAVNGGAIMAGTYGSCADALFTLSTSGSGGGVYFNGAARGSLTVAGNVVWAGTNPDGTQKNIALGNASNSFNTLVQFGGGGFMVTSGAYVEQIYNFTNNQAAGSGGAINAGFITNMRPTLNRYGSNAMTYALVMNPLDWYALGTYYPSGTYALFERNVATKDGGAIAATGSASVYIGSGAQFINNYAGGKGGAIQMGELADYELSVNGTTSWWAMSTGTMTAGVLDLRARVADIVFSGNRDGVSINPTTVDYDILRDPDLTKTNAFSGTAGYMTVAPATGHPNDINFSEGSRYASIAAGLPIAGTLNIDAYEGMKVYFDGGITQTHEVRDLIIVGSSSYTIASSTLPTKNLVVNINRDVDTSTLLSGGTPSWAPRYLDNTTPVGLVWFNNAGAAINGITTVGSGTLRISGSTMQNWGLPTATTKADTLFALGTAATLEANASINAQSINIADGATLRVLSSGTLRLNAGVGGVIISPSAMLNLAGNGTMYLGGSGTLGASAIGSVSVGDIGHTTAQQLLIAGGAAGLPATISLNNTKLNVGLFSGGASDKLVAGNIGLAGTNEIGLSSIAQGTGFVIANALNGPITGIPVFTINYKGAVVDTTTPNPRLTAGVSVSGNNLLLNWQTSNMVLNWNGASDSPLTMTSGNMTGGDSNYVFGDVIQFGAATTGGIVNVNDENIALSAMKVTGPFTFNGEKGITTQASAWGGAPNALADGKLTLNAPGSTLYLYNATGPGAANVFTSGILITAGTLAIADAAQLGAPLSLITFDNATPGAAALRITSGAHGNTVTLSGTNSTSPVPSQQLTIAAGKNATITVNTLSTFTVMDNQLTGTTGGVFNVGAGATLNLNTQGDMVFVGNSADKGGAVSLGDNAVLNITTTPGQYIHYTFTTSTDANGVVTTTTTSETRMSVPTVTFGAQDDRVARTPANTGPGDSISGAPTSVINANGAGILSINSDSHDFAGTLNASSLVAFGPGSSFGTATSRVNVTGTGAVLGGGATINGTVSVSGGALSIDAGQVFGRPIATQAQTQTFTGSLGLNNATIHYNGVVSVAGEYTADVIDAAKVTIGGTTTINFNRLPSGAVPVVTPLMVSTTYIATPNLAAGIIGADGLLYVDGSAPLSKTDYIVTKGGIPVDSQRTTTWVGYLPKTSYYTFTDTVGGNPVVVDGSQAYPLRSIASPIVTQSVLTTSGTPETVTVASNTLSYDPTQFVLVSTVRNQRAYWLGTDATTWDNVQQNWQIQNPNDPAHVFEDHSFFDGDSVVIGATNPSTGAEYYMGPTGTSRSIVVDAAGVQVADMTITGTATWIFTGGPIRSNAGNNNFKATDEVTDMSTGQFVLDKNFTGLVVLANTKDVFPGVFVGGTKSDGFVILGGTLQSTSGILSGNNITDNSTLVFNDTSNSTFVGMVKGTGDIIKTGNGVTTLSANGQFNPQNLYVQQGGITVSGYQAVTIPGTLYVAATGSINVTQELVAATLVNAGVLQRNSNVSGTSGPSSATADVYPNFGQNTMRNVNGRSNAVFLDGDYVGQEGSRIMLATFRDGVFIDNIDIKGNSDGVSYVVLRNIAAMPNGGSWVWAPGADINTPGKFTNTSTALATGTFFKNMEGTSPSAHAYEGMRDTLIVATEGPTRNLKLKMDWANSYIGQDVVYPIVTTSTDIISGSSVVVSTTTSGTYFGQTKENFHLVQGRDSNWYLRNADIAPSNADLPLIAASPAMADLINKANIKAVYQHINARHDPLQKGAFTWVEYAHSQDTVRTDYYYRTVLRQNIVQLGADYTFADREKGDWKPGVKAGVSYAFTSAQATAYRYRSSMNELTADTSKLTVDSHAFNAYLSARTGFFYLDIIGNYSPDANYKTDLSTNAPFDANAEVKGSRMGLSGELGVIITPKGAGQLEIYAQATGEKHKFNKVSNLLPESVAALTDDDGYNPIYDPNSFDGNGRRYHFGNPTTLYGEAGFRWGSNLQATPNITVRPWGGLAYGRNISNDYIIYQDGYQIRNDMRGYYRIVRGGVAAQWKQGVQVYATLEWGDSDVTNNYTLMTGINYHW